MGNEAGLTGTPSEAVGGQVPEELIAVMTESVAAFDTLGSLPPEEIRAVAEHIDGASGRQDRAHRAVQAFRRAFEERRPDAE